MALVEYKIWDRSQRIFHRINALAVLILIGIGIVILNADARFFPRFRKIWRSRETPDDHF